MTLVGTSGVRALTHARVDAAASLPAGSTSNHFRTRAALVSGVITWIAQSERTDAGGREIRSPEDLIDALAQMIRAQSGPLVARTRARYALFLEANAVTVQPLREQRQGMEGWVSGILRELGGADAEARTAFLMASAEGLLLHRITVDPEAPIIDVITRAVHSALEP